MTNGNSVTTTNHHSVSSVTSDDGRELPVPDPWICNGILKDNDQ